MPTLDEVMEVFTDPRFSILARGVDAELEKRQVLRAKEGVHRSVLEYINHVDIPGRPLKELTEAQELRYKDEPFLPIETPVAAHHRLLLEALDRVTSKQHGRLMVFMPPGSAKSTYASVVFPSYLLGKKANTKLILASYGDDLARKMGRRTRSIIKQRKYQILFDCKLTSDSQAANEFALTNGSEYMACGILGGVTGNRAHGIIIDDPVKGRQQADSEATRAATISAYQDDLLTRLIPGGFVILIQTRWNQGDLAGSILPDDWKGESGMIRCKDGNTWEVICLQARCEVANDPLGRHIGEYLWPEWFDRKHWAQYESNQRTWSALYQQLPTPSEGDLFKVDQIQTIDALPAGFIRWVRGWDLGATTSGDYTVGGKLGVLPDGRFVIGGVVRLQRGPHERDAAIINTATADGKQCRIDLPQDPGAAGKTQVHYLTVKLQGYPVVSSPETGDKVVRAEPFASQVNVGNVVMLRGDWNTPLIEELRMFPNGRHDDQVDALSRAFQNLINRGPIKISDETMAAA